MHRSAAPFSSPTSAHSPTCSSVTSPVGGRNRNNHNNNTNCGFTRRQLTSSSSFPSSPSGGTGSPLSAIIAGSAASSMGTGPKPQQQQQQQQQRRSSLVPSSSTNSLTQAIGEDKEGKRKTTSRRQLRRSQQQQQQQLWVDAVTTAAATAGGGHADDGGHLNDESDRDRVAPSRCNRASGEEDEGHRWSRTAPQTTALAVPTSSIVKSQSNDDADSDDDSSGSRASGDSGSAGHVETTVLSLQGAQKEKGGMAKELTCREGSGSSKNNSSGSESESGPERKSRRGSSGSGMRPRTPPPKKPHVRGNSKKTAKQRAATEAAIAAAATSSASSSLASPAYPAWTPAWTPAGTRLGGRAGAVPRSFMGSQTEHPVILGGGSAGLAPAASAFSPLLSSSDASPTTTTIRGEPAPTPQQALKSLSPSTQARMMKRQQQQLAQQHVARSRREQRSQRTHERQWGRDQKVESTLVGLPSPSTQLAANPSGGAPGSSSSGSDEGGNSNGPNAPHHLGRCRSSTSQHNGTGQSSPSPSPGGTRPNRHGQSNEEEDNQQEEEEDRRGGATTPTAAPGRPPHTGIAGRARPSVTIIAPVPSPKEVSPAPTHPPPPTQHQSVDAAAGSNGVLSSSNAKGKVGGSRGDGVAATPATAAAAVRSSPPPPLPRSVSGEKLTYVEAALKPAPTASAAFSASMAGKKLPSRRALHVGTPGANLFIALPQAPSTNVKTRRAEGTGPQGSGGGGEPTMVSGCRYPNYGGPHASSSDHPQALPRQQQHASPCGAASGLSCSSPLYQANGRDQNGHTPHHDHPTPQFFHESIVRHLNGHSGGGGGGGCSNARGLISGGCNYGYGSDFSESVSGGSPPPYPFDSDEDEEAFYYNSLGSPNTFDPTSSAAGAGGAGAPLSPGQRARIRLAQQRRLAAATRSMKAVRKPPRAFCSNCCGVIPALRLSRSSHHLCLNDLAAGGDEDHPDGDAGTGTGGGGARAVEPKNKQAGEDGEDEEEGSSGGGDCGSPSSAKPPITEGERVSRNEEEEVEEGQVGPSPSAAATTSTASPTLWNSYEHAHHCRCAVPTIDRELQAFSAAEVLPGLYLGANADATNMHALQHHGISLVLNVAEECTVLEEMKRNKHHIRYVQVPLKDHSDEVIAPLFAPLTLLIHQQLHRRQIYEERRKIADATSADVDGEESSHNMGTSPGSPSVGGGSGLVKGNLLGADALGNNNNKSFPFSSSPTCVSPTQRGAIIVDADESANPWVATPTVTGQPNLKEGKRETPRTPTPTHPAQPAPAAAPSLRSTPQSPFARFSDTATNSTITMMSCNSRPTSLSPSPLPTRAGSTFPLVSTLPPARAQSRSIGSPCARAATADTPPPPPPPTHASPSTATPTAPPICFANQNSGAGGGGGGNSGNGNHVNDPNSNAAGEDGGIVDPRDCGGVLIHCRMGVSRSASFVLAYLILYGMQLARLDARAVSALFAPGVFDEEKQFIQALGGRSNYGGDDDDDDAAAAAAEKNLSKGGVEGDASAATTYGNGDGDVTADPPEMEESEDNTTTALNSRSSTNVFTPSPSIVSPSPSVVMGSSAPTTTATTTTTRMALDGSANSQDFLTPLQTEAVMPLARPSSLLYGSPTSAPSLTAQQQYQHQQQHDGLVRLNQNMQQQQQMCAGVAAATAPGTHKEAKKAQRMGEQQQQYGDVDNGSAVCAGGSQEGGADEATHVAPRHCTACTADIASGPLAIATTPTRSPTGMNGMFSSASSLCLTSPRERAAMSCRACHELRLRQHLLDTLSSPTSTLTQYSNHNNSNLSKNNGESCVPAGTGSSSSLGNLRHSALSFREAFDYLKKQKPDVNPNIGFVLALRELAGGGDFSISSSM